MTPIILSAKWRADVTVDSVPTGWVTTSKFFAGENCAKRCGALALSIGSGEFRPTGGNKMTPLSYRLVVNDPTRLETVRLPSNGAVEFHAGCAPTSQKATALTQPTLLSS